LNEKSNKTARLLWIEAGRIRRIFNLSTRVFRPRASQFQYLSTREREKLIRDYIWARDSYRKAVIDARRASDEVLPHFSLLIARALPRSRRLRILTRDGGGYLYDPQLLGATALAGSDAA
jgi:hypothetical protein